MKKIITIFLFVFLVTSCTNAKKIDIKNEYSFKDTAILTKTTIKINSITQIDKECFFEVEDVCSTYTEPANDYFLILDLVITNKTNKDITISSILNFELKDENGERAGQQFYLNILNNQLDGTISANTKLKGQIAYDVKESNYYNFYYIEDIIKGEKIKFVINSKDVENRKSEL